MAKKHYLDNPHFNLGWCKPAEYSANEKRIIAAVNEGEIVGIASWSGNRRTHNEGVEALYGKHFDRYPKNDRELIENTICQYLGIEDIDDAKYDELYCSQCPWRSSCEAMDVDD